MAQIPPRRFPPPAASNGKAGDEAVCLVMKLPCCQIEVAAAWGACRLSVDPEGTGDTALDTRCGTD